MGRYPGLAEEALLALRAGKPFYLLGGFGGCARALADAVLDREPTALTREFQERDPAYRDMVAAHDAIPGVGRVDYEALVGEFRRLGVGGLAALNGLSEPENRRLFETPHVIEMVYLVLRGFLNIRGPKAD